MCMEDNKKLYLGFTSTYYHTDKYPFIDYSDWVITATSLEDAEKKLYDCAYNRHTEIPVWENTLDKITVTVVEHDKAVFGYFEKGVRLDTFHD